MMTNFKSFVPGRVIIAISFVFFSLSLCAGQNGQIRSGVIPGAPQEGMPISIGIVNSISPCIGSGDYPTYSHVSQDNHITFVMVALIVTPCPNIPGFGLEYEIGLLPAGEYTAQVYIVSGPSSIPQSINDPLGTPLDGGFSFVVQGSPAVAVPLFSGAGIVVMVILVMVIGFRKSRKTKLMTLIVLMSFSTVIGAKQFILLLSDQPGAPSPEEVVNEGTTSPRPDTYALATFNDYEPSGVAYLLPDRPFGQRLSLINSCEMLANLIALNHLIQA